MTDDAESLMDIAVADMEEYFMTGRARWLTVDEAVVRIRDFAGDGRLLARRWMRQKAVAERRRIRRRKHGY